MFSGSIPALVTPFDDTGAFAEAAFRDHVEWQIAEGSSALVACGTTGEAATMPADEHFRVVRVCVEQARGRVPVIAGAGSNDTRVARDNLRAAKQAGADAALMVPPYYNRPSQEGIFQHFAALAAEAPLPIILYNVPGRTVTDMLPATVARVVAAFPQVFRGIKDATGALARVSQHRASCGADWCQLSGNDDLALAFNAMGGVGCISVSANVAPRLCADFQAAWARGDAAGALGLHDRLFALHEALFADASPGPVKYAMTRMRPGFPPALRLPMTPAGAAAREAVDAALATAGLAYRRNGALIWWRLVALHDSVSDGAAHGSLLTRSRLHRHPVCVPSPPPSTSRRSSPRTAARGSSTLSTRRSRRASR